MEVVGSKYIFNMFVLQPGWVLAKKKNLPLKIALANGDERERERGREGASESEM